jgi:hypothetical protein
VTRRLEKIAQFFPKVAKIIVNTKNAKISSTSLNLKAQNIYIRPNFGENVQDVHKQM